MISQPGADSRAAPTVDGSISNFKITEQAVKSLRRIRAEICAREGELDQLRTREQIISSFVGPVRGAARERAAGRRINWRTVLEQLAKEFTRSDVRKVRGLGGNASWPG